MSVHMYSVHCLYSGVIMYLQHHLCLLIHLAIHDNFVFVTNAKVICYK